MEYSRMSEHGLRSLGLWFSCVAVALALFWPVPSFAAGVSDARAVMAQYDVEVAMASEAYSKKDGAANAQHMQKAREYLNQARDMYEDAGASTSNDADVLREYGAILGKTGDYDLAAEAFERASVKAPGQAWPLREKGRALSLLGKDSAEKAIDALRKSLEIDSASPDAAVAYASLGRAYRQLGLYDLALESLDKALAVDPQCLPAKLGGIAGKIETGEMADASNGIDQLGLLPSESEAEASKLVVEALARFRDARRWFSDTAENHIGYAKLLFRAGRMAEALEAAERSARLGPDAFATWNFVGDLSYQSGHLDRAREAYKRSLELKADQPVTQERLQSLDQQSSQSPAKEEPGAPSSLR